MLRVSARRASILSFQYIESVLSASSTKCKCKVGEHLHSCGGLNNKQIDKISSRRFYSSHVDRKRLVILGTGWSSYSLLKNIDKKKYDVIVISPRNHFLFTPLLASTTVGTLEFR